MCHFVSFSMGGNPWAWKAPMSGNQVASNVSKGMSNTVAKTRVLEVMLTSYTEERREILVSFPSSDNGAFSVYGREAHNLSTPCLTQAAGMDWIIHLDTDELLHPAGAAEYSLRRLLGDVAPEVDMVVFPNYVSECSRALHHWIVIECCWDCQMECVSKFWDMVKDYGFIECQPELWGGRRSAFFGLQRSEVILELKTRKMRDKSLLITRN